MNGLRFLLSAIFGLAGTLALVAGEPATRWTMFNVTPREGQADCHLLKFPDGRQVLIDPAAAWDAPGSALAALQHRGVTEFDLVVISHFHWDHYGQLRSLLRAGVKVRRVVLNVPDQRVADKERPWGCDFEDVQALLRELREQGIPYATATAGERLIESRAPDGTLATLDVICAYDGINTPVGQTDVNDTSIVLRLTHGSTRALFTGDLNHALGAWLARSGLDLQADLLKAPHHGAEGTVPNEFYDRVEAKAVLVPSPASLWRSPRSMRTRNYFLERKIPAYVAGIDGTVTVTLTASGYSIEKER
ncbi:MAG TPA: MBL fold metallo-hydrolase [Opitutaceae bacterium]|nr:MBL fold metallo-hydrolase [Opitutaceae bacterium]